MLRPLVYFLFGAALATVGRAQDFESLLNEYLAGYWKSHPTAATAAGVHAYDTQLDDFSEAARATEIQRSRQYLSQLERLPRGSIAGEVNRTILSDHIRLDLLELEQLRPWKTRPEIYLRLTEQAIRALTMRQFAPPNARFLSVVERLRQIPRLVKQAQANLADPPEWCTRRAIESAAPLVAFLRNGLPRLAREQGVGRRVLVRIDKEAPRAAAAMEDFSRWLHDHLLPGSKGNLVLEKDLFTRVFRYRVGVDLSPEQVWIAAQAEMKRPASQPVLQKPASLDGATGENLLKTYRQALAEAKDFTIRKRLAPVPQPDRLHVASAALPYPAPNLSSPGPFEPELEYFYEVPDAGGGDPAAAAVREGYPGRYLQQEAMNRTPDLVRKVFPSRGFVDGWACYAQQLVNEEGWPIHLDNVEALHAILDVGLNTGQLSREAAIEMLLVGTASDRESAERRAARAVETPGEYSAAYAGKLEILRLRDDLRKRLGAAFVLREFHEKMLGLGAPPPRLARQLMESR